MATISAIVCGALMFGCNGRAVDDFGLEKLKVGISTETDVRREMGPPEKVWDEADGSRTLEYPKGPEGHRTFMILIDQQGIYQSYQQVLTAKNFATITIGMSQDQLRRKLGKPRSVVHLALKNETVWDWLYLDEGGAERLFNAHFDANGKLAQTSTSPLLPDQ